MVVRHVPWMSVLRYRGGFGSVESGSSPIAKGTKSSSLNRTSVCVCLCCVCVAGTRYM